MKRKVYSKFYSHNLTSEQKTHRVETVLDFTAKVKSDPYFLDSAETDDEFLCCLITMLKDTPRNYDQRATPKQRRFAVKKKIKMKTLAIIFFDSDDVTDKDFVPQDVIVSGYDGAFTEAHSVCDAGFESV